MDIKEYIESARERYENRKFDWKADDNTDILSGLEPDLRYIDVWCFSS